MPAERAGEPVGRRVRKREGEGAREGDECSSVC